jgi:hypothetical protein
MCPWTAAAPDYLRKEPPYLTEKPIFDSRKQPEDVLSERLWPEDKDVVASR